MTDEQAQYWLNNQIQEHLRDLLKLDRCAYTSIDTRKTTECVNQWLDAFNTTVNRPPDFIIDSVTENSEDRSVDIKVSFFN